MKNETDDLTEFAKNFTWEKSTVRKSITDYLKSGADKDKVIEDLIGRIEKLQFEFKELYGRSNIVIGYVSSNIKIGAKGTDKFLEIEGTKKDTRKYEIDIFCGYCEEKVSLRKCLNEGGGLTRTGTQQGTDTIFRKVGEDKVVCPDCVKNMGIEMATKKAGSVLEILIKKALA